MSLYCRIIPSDVKLSDIWCDKEAFETLKPDELQELMREDIISFVDELDILNRVEFYWKDSCGFCKREKPYPLCKHGYCNQCGCKEYCWID